MVKKCLGLLSLLLCLSTGTAFSTINDTIKKPLLDNETYLNFHRNLDSLLNLWYVKNGLYKFKEDYSGIDTGKIITFPDSIYMQRIAAIPSEIPLSYNQIVRNFIEMYTMKRRSLVENMLGLTDYYFPVFEDIFDKKDLPTELKYLAIIESALNPRAVSRAGATGLWQFMYGTARIYKLTINSYVDERRDPVKATHAAAGYLEDLYSIYQDWILVIAAYNCGPGNVNKAIRRSGGKSNYWDIYYYLPRETRGYVPAFIAATYMMNYHKEHNLIPRKIELPLVTDTLKVNGQLHLKQVADILDIPIELLRDMNPQFKKDIVPGKYGNHILRIPIIKVAGYIDMQDSIFAHNDTLLFNQDIRAAPSSYTSSTPYSYDPPSNSVKIYYTVKSGDNLGYIAEWYNVHVSDLRKWNNIRWNLIKTGQKLKIYVPSNKAGHYRRINSLSFAQKQKMAGKLVPNNSPSSTSSNSEGKGYIYYTVKSGDTLWNIAREYPGVSDDDIMKLNNISNASKISPGQILKIKKKS